MRTNGKTTEQLIYVQPKVKRLLAIVQEDLLTPFTWNGDVTSEDNMGIIEGDPDGDGKGANSFNVWGDEE